MDKISPIAEEERAQIAEHAFRAGFNAAVTAMYGHKNVIIPISEQSAWLAYEPEPSDDR